MRSGSLSTIGAVSIAGVLLLAGCGRGGGHGAAAPIELRAPAIVASSAHGRGTKMAPLPVAPIDERDGLALPEPLPREVAERKVIDLLATASIDEPRAITEAQARALEAAGFDEDVGLALLLGLLDGCLDEPERAGTCTVRLEGLNDASQAFYRLLPVLARVGSARTVALLSRLEEHGFGFGDLAASVLEARATKRGRAVCVAPTQAEIDKELSDLDDFVIVDADGTAREGREPTPADVADLAYFLVAIRRDRRRLGELSSAPPVLPLEALQALAEEHAAARVAGDREAILRVGLAYFAALGHDLSSGAASSFGAPDEAAPVARSLGRELELRGRFSEAAAAYRRGFADTAEGCGPAGQIYEQAMRVAIVRTEEASGDCRGGVASRLYAPDDGLVDVHGPSRLARAGWDVPRLYRGAALTSYRGELAVPPETNDFLSAPQAERTNARLARWGHEAYDDELRALEGLTDTARLGALPALFARIARGSPSQRQRAINVLVQLAERPAWDVCASERLGQSTSSVASGTARVVRPLNDTCKTVLTNAQRREIVAALVLATKDRDWEIRVAAAQAIGSVATTVPPELTALLRDPEAPLGPGTLYFPVRDTARAAIVAIRAAAKKKKAPLRSTSREACVRHRARCCVAL